MKDLSLHLLDIIQNSISAGAARIEVTILADKQKNLLEIVISDNGTGMDADFLSKVKDPFVTTRTTRKIGLGIPLLMSSAQLAGGDLKIHSEKNKGTTLKASFEINHIDRLPLGDIPETMTSVVIAKPEVEFELVLDNREQKFRFNSFEVKERLGEVPIYNIDVIAWIRDFINEGVKITFGGVLDEVTG